MTKSDQSVIADPPVIALWKVLIIASVASFALGGITTWFLWSHQASEAPTLPATVKLGS